MPGVNGFLLAVVAAVAAAVTAEATATAAIAAETAATTATETTAATTTTAEATTAATPTEAAATARRTLLARTRDVDRQRTVLELVTVKLLDGLLGFIGAAHRDEGEAAGTTGKLVEDDLDDADGADLAEQGLEVLRGAGEGEVPHVELGVV